MSKKYHHEYQRVISFIGNDDTLKSICLNYVSIRKMKMHNYPEDQLFFIDAAKIYYESTLILNLMYRVDMFSVFDFSLAYYFKCINSYYDYVIKKECVVIVNPTSGHVIEYEHKDEGYSQVELQLIGLDNTLGIEKYIISGALHGCSDSTIEYALSEMDKGISAQMAYEKAMDIEMNGSSKLEKMVDDLLDSL